MLVGHPIEYLPEDGQCSVAGGQTGATRLAANTQIDLGSVAFFAVGLIRWRC